MAGLPDLSVLELTHFNFSGACALLPSLTALRPQTSSSQQAAAAPQLSNLVQLHLQHVAVPASLLRSFAVLQRLKLHSVQVLTTDGDPRAVAAATAPQLRSVVELELQGMAVPTSFLRSFLNLQQLVLRDLHLRSANAWQQAQQSGSAASLADVLAVIGQMGRLQRIQLAGLPLRACQNLNRLSSLTACSELQHLTISGTVNSRPLPPWAMHYMLPPGRRLPGLRQLRIEGNPYLSKGETVDEVLALSCVHASCVRRIARCCRGLRVLALCNVLSDSDAVDALTRLTSLTALSLARPVCDDAATAAVAQLAGLRKLSWDALGTVQQNTFPEKAPAVVTVPGLRQLTALRGLTALELVGCGRITTTTLETLMAVSVVCKPLQLCRACICIGSHAPAHLMCQPHMDTSRRSSTAAAAPCSRKREVLLHPALTKQCCLCVAVFLVLLCVGAGARRVAPAAAAADRSSARCLAVVHPA